MQAICEQVGRGDLVKDACRAQSTTRQTLHRWMAEQTDAAAQLRDLYTRARQDQAHAQAELAVEIANGDDALTLARYNAIDAIEDDTDGLSEKAKAGHYKMVAALRKGVIDRDRLRVDTLKWMTSKIAPKVYGDRLETAHSGAVTVTVVYSSE